MSEAIEGTEAQAKRLVARVAKHWEDKPDAFKSECDGTITFTFVIHDLSGSTTITYDPVPAVELLLYKHEMEVESSSAESLAFMDLLHLLNSAPKYFQAVLRELPLLSMTIMKGARYHTIGMETERSKLIQDALENILEVRKLLLGAPGPGRKRKFFDADVVVAVYTLGNNASQRQTAKKLGVSEKALRDWRQEKGLEDWEAVLQTVKQSEYYQALLSRDTPKRGRGHRAGNPEDESD